MSSLSKKLLFTVAAMAIALVGSVRTQEAQASAKPPQALDAMLARAMQSNPEVLLAQARLEQARAELNQVRLKVTQEIIEVHAQRQALKLRIRSVHERMEQAKQLYSTGLLPADELRNEQVTLIETEGALASSEAQVRYLLGMGGMVRIASGQETAPIRKALPLQRPPIPERFAKALEMPIAASFTNVTLRALLQSLSEVSGVAFLFAPDFKDEEKDWMLSIDFRENPATLRQILIAISDLHGSACFAIRDYGMLVTHRHLVRDMPVPVIPETVPLRQ